jgi:protoporphyrinogen oxidase
VVGAGIAGLSAALRLRQSGAEVTVFESSDRVGGRTSSETQDGYPSNQTRQIDKKRHAKASP